MTWPKKRGIGDADVRRQNVAREEMWRPGEPRRPQYVNLNHKNEVL